MKSDHAVDGIWHELREVAEEAFRQGYNAGSTGYSSDPEGHESEGWMSKWEEAWGLSMVKGELSKRVPARVAEDRRGDPWEALRLCERELSWMLDAFPDRKGGRYEEARDAARRVLADDADGQRVIRGIRALADERDAWRAGHAQLAEEFNSQLEQLKAARAEVETLRWAEGLPETLPCGHPKACAVRSKPPAALNCEPVEFCGWCRDVLVAGVRQ